MLVRVAAVTVNNGMSVERLPAGKTVDIDYRRERSSVCSKGMVKGASLV